MMLKQLASAIQQLHPLRTTLLYLLIASLWLLLSDWLVSSVPGVSSQLLLVKGWVFMLATAGLLYLLLRRLQVWEQRYQELFEANPQPLWVYDLDTLGFLAVNEAACRSYGYSRDEFLSLTIKDISPLEDVAKLRQSVKATRGFEQAGVWRHRKKSGAVIEVELTSSDLRFSGRAARLVLAQDVTERRIAEQALRQSEALLRAASRVAAIGAWSYDPDSELFSCSPELYQLYGMVPSGPLRNQDFRQVEHPDDRERIARNWQQALAGARYDIEYRILKSGRVRWLREVGEFERDAQGRLLRGVGVVQDITEDKAREVLIMRQAQALEQSPSIAVLTDTAGMIEYVNRRFTEVTGYSAKEVIGRHSNLLKSGLMSDETYAELWRTITSGQIWRGEFPDRKKSGELYWEQAVIAPIRDEQGTITHFVKLAEDITDKKALSERLEYLAFYDPLTGLANRALLMDRLEQALAVAKSSERSVAVAFVDLDDFKLINSSLGDTVGDQLLIEVAQRLKGVLRDDDTVARFGGDEFALLLDRLATAQDASLVVERALNAMSKPFTIAEQPIFVSASIGVAVFPDDADSGPALIRHAGVALNRAKQEGRRRYQFFTPELNEQMLEQVQLVSAMRQGLTRGEFLLHYQPRVDLLRFTQDSVLSGQVVSLEALVRWRHPTLGLLSPGRFIPLAEQSDLILELGQEVLRQVCQQLRRWLDEGLAAVPVAINLSAKELGQPDIVQKIRRRLQEAGLPPHYLEIEITESAAMSEVEQTAGALDALQALGVNIAIDDFGTAYSSLNYLKRLPVQALKIDRGFVAELNESATAQDTAVIRAIIGLGQSYDLTVVAEGVETEFQRASLQRMGCRYAQGYLFSRPVPAAEIRPWLSGPGPAPTV
ncbi:MAG: EAL domain-containing protein [Truepera sp.]|nr:EAL domain-containing protein [Truepera sp.]